MHKINVHLYKTKAKFCDRAESKYERRVKSTNLAIFYIKIQYREGCVMNNKTVRKTNRIGKNRAAGLKIGKFIGKGKAIKAIAKAAGKGKPKGGIKTLVTQTGINFGVSGVVGGTLDFVLPPGFNTTRQHIAIRVPAGKRLILTTARFCLDSPGNRLLVTPLVGGGHPFQSNSNCAEERPNFILFSNASVTSVTVTVFFQINNVGSIDSTVFQSDGWFVNFRII